MAIFKAYVLMCFLYFYVKMEIYQRKKDALNIIEAGVNALIMAMVLLTTK